MDIYACIYLVNGVVSLIIPVIVTGMGAQRAAAQAFPKRPARRSAAAQPFSERPARRSAAAQPFS